MNTCEPTPIGSRLELFVDDTLIESLGGQASLRLHQPTIKELALVTDRPWEGNMCGGYKTCFRDGNLFRLYYQAWNLATVEVNGKPVVEGGSPVRIGYIESEDGIHWQRPSLGLIDFKGSTDNNLVFAGLGKDRIGTHGFAPFKDPNPTCPAEARYKALGANELDWPLKLYALQSPDGLHWSLIQEEPVMTEGTFDSQNLAFWDSLRGEYRAYIRHVSGNFFRGIMTCTSSDFVHWTKPEWLEYPGSPTEQLYTNQVLPYYRAPHLFLGFPTRYTERLWSPSIEALPELEHRRMRARISERYGAALTDGQFMASRDGRAFKRWDEAFIRPGLRPVGSWAYGDCYQGWGLIETASDVFGAPNELSMFVSEGYWRGTGNAIRRYTLRIDGFVSLHAPLGGGELTTKPLIFEDHSKLSPERSGRSPTLQKTGTRFVCNNRGTTSVSSAGSYTSDSFDGWRLLLNISTSAGGGARVEVQSPDGRPLDGFALDDCIEIIGDSLEFPVQWRGDIATLCGQPVRLRFVLRDADLYSYRFASGEGE